MKLQVRIALIFLGLVIGISATVYFNVTNRKYDNLMYKFDQRGDSLRTSLQKLEIEDWRSAKRRDSVEKIIVHQMYRYDSALKMNSITVAHLNVSLDKYKKMNAKQLQHEADSIYNAAIGNRPGR